MKPKGLPKTGGRAPGTPNKVTTEMKTWLSGLLDKNRKQFERDLKRLEPHQRVLLFEKLLSYSIPKMQATTAQIDFGRLSDEQLEIIINELTKNLENE